MNTLILTDEELRLLHFWAALGMVTGGFPKWTTTGVVGSLAQKMATSCDKPIERENAAKGEHVTAE